MALTLNGTTNTIGGLAVGGLPDGIVDTDMLAASAVTSAKASGSAKGITEFDTWRVTAGFTAQNADLTSNWERADTDFGKIGTGLTESSGIFTFPSTGKYLIDVFIASLESGGTRYHGAYLSFSTNSGSSFSDRSAGLVNAYNAGADSWAQNFFTVMLDVTNISTNQMKIRLIGDSTISYNGDSNYNQTGFTCMKLGDT